MKQLIFIFVGGGMGSLTRFFLGKLIQEKGGMDFPLGTLIVNLSASLLLGFFIGFVEAKSVTNPAYRALIAVGFCGGFSTFSTFANDTLILMMAQRPTVAFLNILLNVVLCLTATFAGLWVGKVI